LLLFGTESFVFHFAIQKVKDQLYQLYHDAWSTECQKYVPHLLHYHIFD